MAAETRETRLKRLKIRSWRRGVREMDMLLGPYADEALAALDDAALAEYESLLEVGDPDLYAWLSGAAAEDARHGAALARVRAFHGIDA